MTYFRLYIDGRESIVRSTAERLRKAMYAHIKRRMAEGARLSEIEYCWTHVSVGKV